MGGDSHILLEEKALRHDHQCILGSFEDNISVFSEEEKYSDDGFLDCDGDNDDESDGNDSQDSMERTVFWESQESLLQEILEHYSSSGSKLRQEITRLIERVREPNFCNCPKPKTHGCAKCLRQKVVNLLCNKGFKATLCTSKWNKTQKFPGGTHEYIEVIASTHGRKKPIPFLIEMEFRDEFKMGKACDEYHKLINQLPEIYIGKPDHLDAIVRVVCNAAKRSTTENKIHMGPWRKRSFMQMKWSASHERHQSANKHRLISSTQGHTQISTVTAVKVA